MSDFIITLLKRMLFHISTILVMVGMVGILDETARLEFTGKLGFVRGEHAEGGTIAVRAVLVLIGLFALYRLTRKIDPEA
jgi:hypothetical protein